MNTAFIVSVLPQFPSDTPNPQCGQGGFCSFATDLRSACLCCFAIGSDHLIRNRRRISYLTVKLRNEGLWCLDCSSFISG